MYREWTQIDQRNKHYNTNRNSLQHVQRMEANRLTIQVQKYKQKVVKTRTDYAQNRWPKLSPKFKPKWLQYVKLTDKADYQNKYYNIKQNCLQQLQSVVTNTRPNQALHFKPKLITSCIGNGHKQTIKH